MRLYRVVFDGEPNFVEAPNLGAAVSVWRTFLIAENEPGDIEDDVEPESIELMQEGRVWRVVSGVAENDAHG